MRIGQVAQATRLPVKTLRFYEEIGVLAAPPRTEQGYRDYPEESLDQISFIKASQSVGLSLKEIREIMAYRAAGVVPCEHVVSLLNNRAGDYRSKIAELSAALVNLESLLTRAKDLKVDDCLPGEICHLIPPTAVADTSTHEETSSRPRPKRTEQ